MIPGGMPLVFRFRSFHLKPSVFSSFIFFHIQVCLPVLSSWFDYFQLCLIANYLLCISFSFLSDCLFGFSLMFNRVSFGVFGLGSFFHLDLFLNFLLAIKLFFPLQIQPPHIWTFGHLQSYKHQQLVILCPWSLKVFSYVLGISFVAVVITTSQYCHWLYWL